MAGCSARNKMFTAFLGARHATECLRHFWILGARRDICGIAECSARSGVFAAVVDTVAGGRARLKVATEGGAQAGVRTNAVGMRSDAAGKRTCTASKQTCASGKQTGAAGKGTGDEDAGRELRTRTG